MAFSVGSSSAQTSEINVTPLIDVLLVLLIIFMVILPVAPQGLESSIPQSKALASNALPPVVLRLLTSDAGKTARYDIASEGVPRDLLAAKLQAAFALREDRTIFIQADRSLSYSDVAEAVSEAREAGAGPVVLSGLQK